MATEDLSPIRQKVKKFIDEWLLDTPVTSNGNTAARFTKLTGTTHDWLQKRWEKEQKAKDDAIKEGRSTKGLPTTTTCNGLAGEVGKLIGSRIALSQFEIEKELKAAGLGEAWIPAKSGKRPLYGDCFRPWTFHVGVSLDFAGDTWNTAESGQGGPSAGGGDYTTGFDIVKRKQRQWIPADIQGWVDLDILMRIQQKSPKWMVGWWRFEVAAAKEFVYLPERGTARSYVTAPANIKLPPPAGGKSGSLTHDSDTEGVAIAWPDNVTDTLRHLPAVDYMLGQRGAQQLQAFKMK